MKQEALSLIIVCGGPNGRIISSSTNLMTVAAVSSDVALVIVHRAQPSTQMGISIYPQVGDKKGLATAMENTSKRQLMGRCYPVW